MKLVRTPSNRYRQATERPTIPRRTPGQRNGTHDNLEEANGRRSIREIFTTWAFARHRSDAAAECARTSSWVPFRAQIVGSHPTKSTRPRTASARLHHYEQAEQHDGDAAHEVDGIVRDPGVAGHERGLGPARRRFHKPPSASFGQRYFACMTTPSTLSTSEPTTPHAMMKKNASGPVGIA